MTNHHEAAGTWKQIKGQFRQAFGEFTDNEVEQTKGEREELVGMIQEKYGETKAAAERKFDQFMADIKEQAEARD